LNARASSPPGVIAASHGSGGRHHFAQWRGHSSGQDLNHSKGERRRNEAHDDQRDVRAETEGVHHDHDPHRGEDHHAQFHLDRREEVERPHSPSSPSA
jgi:hypothetical protein